MNDSSYYIIDKQLKSRKLVDYLSLETSWQHNVPKFETGEVWGDYKKGPVLPIVSDGQILPGVLYHSPSDPNIRCYLPLYRLHAIDGRYTTSLNWRKPLSDPNGPLASLTLEVIGQPPNAQDGATLLEIPHQAVVRIGYQPNVAGQLPTTGTIDSFIGTWTNVDPNTRTMTRIEISPSTSQSVNIRGYGACHPQACDWGIVQATLSGNTLTGTYDFGFKQSMLTMQRSGEYLLVENFNRFSNGSSRTDKDRLIGGGLSRPQLWIEVGLLKPVGESNVRRAVLSIVDKRDFDCLYQAMTDASLNARLEIRCFSQALRRTWRQVVIDRPELELQKDVLRNKKVLYTKTLPSDALKNSEIHARGPAREITATSLPEKRIEAADVLRISEASMAELLRPSDASQPSANPIGALVAKFVSTLGDRNFAQPAASPILLTAPRRPETAVDHAFVSGFSTVLAMASTASASEQPSLTTRNVLNEVLLSPLFERAFSRPLAESLDRSDIHVKTGDRPVNAVPLSAYVDEDGKPALVRITTETLQHIAPFWFLKDVNAYMFNVPDNLGPSSTHTLIRMEVRDGAGQVRGVFYQDSAFDDLFYYQPQEFRLPRMQHPPYLPELRVVFFDLVSQADGGSADQAELNYKVQLAYRAIPYMDPLVLDLAQQQVSHVKARFSALAPENATLSLLLPKESRGGALERQERPDVRVHFDQGIVDQIEMSRTEFESMFAFFKSPSGIGVEGEVEAALLGNLKAHVPVRLSLKQMAGTALSHTYLGPYWSPQGELLHRVRVSNPLESPVTITALFRTALGGGAFAFPRAQPGAVIEPGGQMDLDYSVSPEQAAVADIFPDLSTSVEVSHELLWPKLFVNQGYTSENFTVLAVALADFFGQIPPGGGEPLSGMLVEFEEGKTATLTAARLQAEIRLRIPLLPRLMGAAQAKKYRYRTTNLLGNDAHLGAQSGWMEGEGEETLTIVPAGG